MQQGGERIKAWLKSHMGSSWRIASGCYWATRGIYFEAARKFSPLRLVDMVEGVAFDARYGTQTREIVPVERLGIIGDRASQARWYEASSGRLVRKLVRASGIDPESHTFVDLGCGRGKVLVIAAEIGFRQVVGVELSPQLAADAARLASRFSNVSVVIQDATQFRFPPGSIFVYLYNPFDADVLRAVIKNLPPCVVAYVNTWHAAEFAGFVPIDHGFHRGDEWRIYKSPIRH